MKHFCPVCGFAELSEPARSQSGGGSYEICPSCGFQFGVSDDDEGYTYAEWREEWKKNGMKWAGTRPSPKNWDPGAQLKKLARTEPEK